MDYSKGVKMSLILSIEEAKEKGMTRLVEQLERDLARRELLKMAPLEEVKDKTEATMWKEMIEDDWD
jgi:RNA-binding protein YhbY